mmetsp:Transcript_51530/g.142658  ORF Transcript_51530/g.142658 Transcript_51530/m.142658 type:complete len:211 (-) Transcript_51530:861-1493(-)
MSCTKSSLKRVLLPSSKMNAKSFERDSVDKSTCPAPSSSASSASSPLVAAAAPMLPPSASSVAAEVDSGGTAGATPVCLSSPGRVVGFPEASSTVAGGAAASSAFSLRPPSSSCCSLAPTSRPSSLASPSSMSAEGLALPSSFPVAFWAVPSPSVLAPGSAISSSKSFMSMSLLAVSKKLTNSFSSISPLPSTSMVLKSSSVVRPRRPWL